MNDTVTAKAAGEDALDTKVVVGAEGGDGGGANGHDTQTAELDSRARRLGWRPEAEFRGKGEWLPAEKFIEKIETEAPVRNERLRFLEDELQKRDRQLSGLTGTVTEQGAALKEMLARARSADQNGYDRAVREKAAEVEAAAERADGAAHKTALAELRELERNKPAVVEEKKTVVAEPAKVETPTIPAHVQEWVRENPWFDADPVANLAAVGFHGKNLKAGMSDAESLKLVRAEIEKRFPEHFENVRRTAPAVVTLPSGGERRTGKKEHTVADLPADAKAELTRFKKLIPGFTDKDFLADYKWDA